MKKLNYIKSKAVVFNADDVDTDQIIPARFLKRTTRDGYGDALFHDLRFNQDGSVNSTHPLNVSKEGKEILVTGRNFGCGSSREHAAWALRDGGFRVIVAASFADIFRINALNNGLLPIVLPELIIHTIIRMNDPVLEVDLEKQEFNIVSAGIYIPFEIDSYRKNCLLNGYDDTGLLLSMKADISQFESTRPYAKIL